MTAPPEPAAAAAMLVSTASSLYRRGWLDGTAGNLSVRVSGGTGDVALITASGRSKGELTAGDTVLVGAATGRPVRPGGPRPSAETSIHTALYRITGCGAVVHAHPPYATVVAAQASRNAADDVQFRDFEIIKGFGVPRPELVSVPLFENWPDVNQIADDVARRLGGAGPQRPPALLIAYHGATAWGPTLAAARDRLECLEALCQLQLLDTAQPVRQMEEAR